MCLPVILLGKIFSHFEDLLFGYLLNVDHEAADVDDITVLDVRVIFRLLLGDGSRL